LKKASLCAIIPEETITGEAYANKRPYAKQKTEKSRFANFTFQPSAYAFKRHSSAFPYGGRGDRR
jgi:hypothetical protein